jgi:hypothetical protein
VATGAAGANSASVLLTPTPQFPEIAAAFTAAKRGALQRGPFDEDEQSRESSIRNAEVAEWQTQRIQNPPSERA